MAAYDVEVRDQNSEEAQRQRGKVTYWKRTVVESQAHDTFGRVINGSVHTTAVRPGANLGTTGVNARSVDGGGAHSRLRGRCDIGDLTGLNGGVEGLLPCLRHRARIRR